MSESQDNMNLSRRAMLGRAAALPAAAMLPISALAADPVYAAIERHKLALAHFNACCRLTDDVVAREEGRTVTQDDLELHRVADDAEATALQEVLTTPPVSIHGTRALLEYVGSIHRICGLESDHFDDFFEAIIRSPVFASA